MQSTKPGLLAGMSLGTLLLVLAGCSSTEATGPQALAANCAGSAYDDVLFNTDDHEPSERARVVATVRNGLDDSGNVTEAAFQRVVNVTGGGNARAIMDAYDSCMRSQR